MSAPDPGWKDVASYLWAVLLLPVGVLWKKADNAVSREEMETHRKEDRENFRQLYANAEEDRKVTREAIQGFSNEMHAMENRLRDKIEAK